MRLDVVLHGSSKPVGMSELRFGTRFDQGDENGTPGPDVNYIELHPLGRVENCYRWAGETDVLEAINDCISPFIKNKRMDMGYNLVVDLQGFSMGGAGAWHLGLHNPGRWRSVEAGAGFNETIHYARLKNVPLWVKKTLHIYDSYEWARNIAAVPTIGYGGEEDPQLAASKNVVGN